MITEEQKAIKAGDRVLFTDDWDAEHETVAACDPWWLDSYGGFVVRLERGRDVELLAQCQPLPQNGEPIASVGEGENSKSDPPPTSAPIPADEEVLALRVEVARLRAELAMAKQLLSESRTREDALAASNERLWSSIYLPNSPAPQREDPPTTEAPATVTNP